MADFSPWGNQNGAQRDPERGRRSPASRNVPRNPGELDEVRRDLLEESAREREEKLAMGIRADQGEKLSEGARLELERFKRALDEDTKGALEKLGEGKDHAFHTLRTATVIILAGLLREKKLADANISIPDFIRTIRTGRRYPAREETLVSDILEKIGQSAETNVKQKITAEWSEWTGIAASIQPGMSALDSVMRMGGVDAPYVEPTPKRGKKKEVEGTFARWYHDHPTLTKVGIGLGAVAAFGFIGKLLWGAAKKVAVAATPDAVKQVVSPGEGIVSRAWGVAKIAGLALLGACAWGWLKKYIPESMFSSAPLYPKLAEKMGLEKETLSHLKGVPLKQFLAASDKDSVEAITKEWGDFLGVKMETSSFGRSEIPLLGWGVPFSGIKEEEVSKTKKFLKLALTDKTVQARLAAFHVDIHSPSVKVGDVLAVLNDMEKHEILPAGLTVAAAVAAGAPGAKTGPDGKKPEGAPEGQEKGPEEGVLFDNSVVVGASKETLEDLKGMLKDDAPHMSKVFEKWETQGLSQAIIHGPTFYYELVAAAKQENKVSLIIQDGKPQDSKHPMLSTAAHMGIDTAGIFITNGTKMVLLTQYNTFIDVATTAAKSIVCDDVTMGNVAEAAWKNVGAFVIGGGILGGLSGSTGAAVDAAGKVAFVTDKSILGRLFGAAKGAGRGALFPVTAAWQEYRAGKLVVKAGREAKWLGTKLFYGEAIDKTVALERMRFYGERYMASDRLRSAALGTGGNPNPVLSRMKVLLKMYAGDIEKDMSGYAERYAKAYNSVYASEIAAGTKPGLGWDPKIGERFKIFADTIRSEAGTLEEAMRLEGLSLPKQSFLGKFWGALKPYLGPAAAALTIYHIETSPDQKKALAEITLGYAGFIAGVGVTDRTIGKLLKNSPRFRAFADIVGGMAGALGLTKNLEDLVKDYFLRFPGAEGASRETLGIIEAVSTKTIVKSVEGKVLSMAAKRGFSTFFERKIQSTFQKRIATVAAKTGLKSLLKSMGVKGAITVGIFADDATVIGVADDIIGIGFLAWMAKDIYDLQKVVREAQAIKNLMHDRSSAEILSLEIVGPGSAKTAWEEEKKNMTPENEEQVSSAFFAKFTNLELKITRQGKEGYEVWGMENGEATRLSFYDANNKEVASVGGSDAYREAVRGLPQGEPANDNALAPEEPIKKAANG